MNLAIGNCHLYLIFPFTRVTIHSCINVYPRVTFTAAKIGIGRDLLYHVLGWMKIHTPTINPGAYQTRLLTHRSMAISGTHEDWRLTIYQTYVFGLCKGISPQNMAQTYGTNLPTHLLDPGQFQLNRPIPLLICYIWFS